MEPSARKATLIQALRLDRGKAIDFEQLATNTVT